jgi:threonine aldolase
MRQAGILAAAGHFALDNNIKRLADDHKLAKSIAKAIYEVAPKVVNPDEVDTNIVGLDLTGLSITAAELSATIERKWNSRISPCATYFEISNAYGCN